MKIKELVGLLCAVVMSGSSAFGFGIKSVKQAHKSVNEVQDCADYSGT